MARPCVHILNVSRETLSNHPGYTSTSVEWSTDQPGDYSIESGGLGYLEGSVLTSGTLAVSGTTTTILTNTDLLSGNNRINIYVSNAGDHTAYNQDDNCEVPMFGREGSNLLIHSNHAHGSTDIIDSSPAEHVISVHSGACHSTDESKFGQSSLYLNNSGYLTLATSSSWDLFRNDFTIDFWMYTLQRGVLQGIFRSHIGFAWHIYLGSQCELVYDPGHNPTQTTYPINNWVHIAFTRKMIPNTYHSINRAFRNGNLMHTRTIYHPYNYDYANGTLYIGRHYGGDQYFRGYIDELRLANGVCWWEEEFDPPEGPYY